MRIIDINGSKFIDQPMHDYINKIWLNYDIKVKNDSNIYFAPNTTINRLIIDHCDTGISRVIKKSKADYVIIKKINLSTYPQFYDGVNLTDDISKEVVYAIYNQSSDVIDTIQVISDFLTTGQQIEYVNQDILNESLNNGFVINKDTYITIKQLIDSSHSDNHALAANMLVSSDLAANWQWILYMYHSESHQLQLYDKKDVVINYLKTRFRKESMSDLFNSYDTALNLVTDNDVRNCFIQDIRGLLQSKLSEELEDLIHSKYFEVLDFKLDYKGPKPVDPSLAVPTIEAIMEDVAIEDTSF